MLVYKKVDEQFSWGLCEELYIIIYIYIPLVEPSVCKKELHKPVE